MSNNKQLKPVALALGAAFAASLSTGSLAQPGNPFAQAELGNGYMVAGSHEGRCGEGKCGGKAHDAEAKCGEGKCGGKAESEAKCGEGKCGGKAESEAKCGEGKCGGKAKSEAKCGEAKCGGSK